MIKVFLVEDEIIIRNGIKNSINWEMHGYDFVGEASDGELALPMILEKKPDILITDIKMPFMDGLELSEQVKKVLPATKIMILSGYNEFDYAKMAIKIGVTDYLLKPISSEKLLDAVNKVAEEIRKERISIEGFPPPTGGGRTKFKLNYSFGAYTYRIRPGMRWGKTKGGAR